MTGRWQAASLLATLTVGLGCAPPVLALDAAPAPAPAVEADAQPATAAPAGTSRSGREIYLRFREGLADPHCAPGTSDRWRGHFAHIPKQMAGSRGGDMLPLFGYVVDALREAHLPTEFALIPFVESGYRPGARSPAGPAGLWQFVALTARNHRIPVGPAYDGRLSPVDSTRAAVRYLKTLHGMFAGDWRLAVMAYNAGEYRVLSALKRHGQKPMGARPEELTSLAGITQAYVRKLHALSCLLAEADDGEEWMRALDRPVPRLTGVDVATAARDIDAWAERRGQDPAMIRRLNPALGTGRIDPGQRIIAAAAPTPGAAAGTGAGTAGTVAASSPPPAVVDGTPASAQAAELPAGDGPGVAPPVDAEPIVIADASAPAPTAPRTHVVSRGESAWTIARRYGVRLADLLARNGLDPRAVLRPGMSLVIDEGAALPAPAAVATGAVAN